MRPSIQVTGPATLTLYENPTFSAAGTAISAWGRNRRAYAGAANLTLTHSPTVSDNGTEIDVFRVLGQTTVGSNVAGGSAGGAYEENLLREGFDYLLELRNDDASAIEAVFDLTWYEDDVS